MGLQINRDKKGLYKMKSSTSGEAYFDGKAVSEDTIKKQLIENAIWTFIEKVVEIDMDFPNGYFINGKYENDGNAKYLEWWLAQEKNGTLSENLAGKFEDALKRLDIKFKVG